MSSWMALGGSWRAWAVVTTVVIHGAAAGCGSDAGPGSSSPDGSSPLTAAGSGVPNIAPPAAGSGGAFSPVPPTAAGGSAAAAGVAAPSGGAGSPAAQPPSGVPVPPGGTAPPVTPPEPPEPMEPAVMRPAGWQEASHARGSDPDYARLFADDKVQRIDIELTAESMKSMEDDLEMLLGAAGMGQNPWGGAPGGGRPGGGNPTDLVGDDPIYVPVTVRYADGVWTQVGMRFKGNSSLASAWRTGVKKIGFRLDFDRYEEEHPETLDQRFYGFGKMTFSSGFRDPSLIRDKLAAELLASAGHVAARCAFYQIYVNAGSGPVYWGLYTMIEDPADQLVEAQFTDKSGNLYKPDGTGAAFATFDQASFEKKTNEEAADYSDVMAVFSALHASRSDAAAWRAGLEAVFDVPEFLSVLAFSRAIGHWDGYGVMAHNYYLYADPADAKRLTWISWDHNLSWQGAGGFGGFGTLSIMMDETTEDWPLIRYLLDDSQYRAQYQEALRAALGGGYTKAMFDARAQQLHTLVAPYVLGENGQDGEEAPYTFITDPSAFRSALSDGAGGGLLGAADGLREQVQAVLSP
ncbi:MAG: CotH kinase family protein [Polyangiales bacterium]